MFTIRIGVGALIAALLAGACGPLADILNDPQPCGRATPPAAASVKHSADQEIPVGDQQLMVLYPLTDVPVYSGPDRRALVLDGHAIICNVYVLVPDKNGATMRGDRSHVAQVYTAAGWGLIALWNRSGWIENSRLRAWKPEK